MVNNNLKGRILYLDNLRVFCMIFGVYYHAAFLGDYQLFDKIISFSGIFRMETFFAVSGFFVAFISERKNTSSFLKKRSLILMMPFISTLILVNPFTIYLTYGYAHDMSPGSYTLRATIDWLLSWKHGGPELHLWFLLILLAYTYLFFMLKPVLLKIAKWSENNPRSITLSPITFGICYALLMMTFFYSARFIDFPRLTPAFIEHLPYFLLGALTGYSKTILTKLNQLNPPLIVLGLLALTVSELYRGPGWGPASVFCKGILSVSIVFTLNWAFSVFLEKSSRLTRILSSSIYTVYLFHQFFLIAIVTMLGLTKGDLKLIPMLALATFVVILGVVFHIAIIDKSSALTFLFSGKKRA